MLTLFNMVIDTEKLTRYIEKLKIERAEAIQKFEELKRLFGELYQDTFWLYDFIQTQAPNKLGLYSLKREKFDNINKTWEFKD